MFTEYIYIFIAVMVVIVLTSFGRNNYTTFLEILILIPLIPTLLTLRTAPYVPSKKDKIDTMLKLARLQKGEVVYDLGAGDGRLIDAAAARGTKAKGIEISIIMCIYYWIRGTFAKTSARMTWGNLWSRDYSDADVLFIFLMPKPMQRFEREIMPKLKKGTRMISNAFKIENMKSVREENGVYLYIK